jgi:hypothetical protein
MLWGIKNKLPFCGSIKPGSPNLLPHKHCYCIFRALPQQLSEWQNQAGKAALLYQHQRSI